MRLVPILAVAAFLAGPAAFAQNAPDPGAECDRLASHPDDPDRVTEGHVLAEIDLDAAEPICRAAVATHPEERRYLYQLGRILHGKSDLEGALAAFQKAADMGSAGAWYGLGLVYFEAILTDPDDAKSIAYFRKAIELGSPGAAGALGQMIEQGRVEGADISDAIDLYRKAIEGGHLSALIDLGWIYAEGRGVAADRAEAEKMFRRAIDEGTLLAANDGMNALAWLIATGQQDDRLAEALDLATRAIDRWPSTDPVGRAAVLDTRGYVRLRQDAAAEAVADFEEAVRLDTEEASYFDHLGNAYAALGRNDDARTAWEKSLALPAPDPLWAPDWNADGIRAKIDALP